MIRASLLSVGIRAAGSAAAFAFALLVARRFGPEGSGAFFYGFALLALSGVVARFGMDTIMLRDVAVHVERQRTGAAADLLLQASVFGLACSTVFAVVIASASGFIGHMLGSPSLGSVVFWLACGLVPSTLTYVWAEALKARGDVVAGHAFQTLWAPTLAVTALWLLTRADLTVAMQVYTLASLTAMLACGLLAWRRFGHAGSRASWPPRGVLSEGAALTAMNLAVMANGYVDVLVLGFFADDAAVGAYGAATKLVLLVHMIPLAMTGLVGPRFAQLKKKGDFGSFSRYARKAARTSLLLSLPPLLALLAFAEPFLSLFGEGFRGSSDALVVLSLGFLGSQMLGFGGLALAMTGQSHLLVRSSLLALAVNVGLGVALAPTWGGLGVALAMAASMLVVKAAAAAFLWRRHRVLITI